MALNHILIPYFTSDSSWRAARHGIELAKEHDCVITVMAFMPISFLNQGFFLLSGNTAGSFIGGLRPELESLKKQADDSKVKFFIEMRSFFNLEQAIIDFVDQNNVDFIIIGEQGKLFNLTETGIDYIKKNTNCIIKIME
ncbi:MAG: universal stress protein [Nitrosarchaeum sp.]|nr:universal stress protein [Nitrosarchaeum sp.]